MLTLAETVWAWVCSLTSRGSITTEVFIETVVGLVILGRGNRCEWATLTLICLKAFMKLGRGGEKERGLHCQLKKKIYSKEVSAIDLFFRKKISQPSRAGCNWWSKQMKQQWSEVALHRINVSCLFAPLCLVSSSWCTVFQLQRNKKVLQQHLRTR